MLVVAGNLAFLRWKGKSGSSDMTESSLEDSDGKIRWKSFEAIRAGALAARLLLPAIALLFCSLFCSSFFGVTIRGFEEVPDALARGDECRGGRTFELPEEEATAV